MRFFLQLSYNGQHYSGWQRQNNAISVQEVIEENLSKIFNDKIEIVGCGRTDAGVHAHQYYAHFDVTPKSLKGDFENNLPENFLHRINNMLTDDVSINEIFEVKPDFHARFDAINRTYKYFIHYKKNPFLEEQSFLLNQQPDVQKMNHCIQQLFGEHDFSTFEKKGSDNKTSICTLENAYWETTSTGLIFTITANRFLRNMVRRITAALLMVGLDKMNEQDLINAVLNKEELNVKMAVPAKGLFLWQIKYNF